MKTTLIFKTGMALLLIIGLTFNTYAIKDTTSTEDKSLEKKSAELMKINVPSNMDTYVSILNKEGSMIYSDKILKNNNDFRKYDFSKVKDGKYTFMTDTEYKSIEKTVLVKNNKLKLVNEKVNYRPVFNIKGDILSVNYMNSKESDIHISITGSSLYHYEDFAGNNMMFGKRFNLKKLPEGEYSITLRAGWKTFNYNFNK